MSKIVEQVVTCATEGCDRDPVARGLCARCYQARRRSGDLPVRLLVLHRVSDIDPALKTGVCTVCGPVKVRLARPGKSAECGNQRRKHAVAYNGKPHRKYPQTQWRKHGLTKAQFDSLVLAVGGRCQICHREDPLTIDHDHACCPGRGSCGRCIRGLLCAKCNAGLGLFKDDPDVVSSAAAYISGQFALMSR